MKNRWKEKKWENLISEKREAKIRMATMKISDIEERANMLLNHDEKCMLPETMEIPNPRRQGGIWRSGSAQKLRPLAGTFRLSHSERQP